MHMDRVEHSGENELTAGWMEFAWNTTALLAVS